MGERGAETSRKIHTTQSSDRESNSAGGCLPGFKGKDLPGLRPYLVEAEGNVDSIEEPMAYSLSVLVANGQMREWRCTRGDIEGLGRRQGSEVGLLL